MICAHVNDTDEKAQESGKAFLWRMGHPLKGPREYWSPRGISPPPAPQPTRCAVTGL